MRPGVHGLDHPIESFRRPPLDLAIIRRDGFDLAAHMSIDTEDEYFIMIRTRWGVALQKILSEPAESELVVERSVRQVAATRD
jgi:predicted proteasome-type protease